MESKSLFKENMSHPTPGQWAWIDLPNGGQSGTGIGVQYLLKDGMTRKQLDDLAPEMPVFVLSHPSFLLNTAARNAFLDLYEVPPTDQEEKGGVDDGHHYHSLTGCGSILQRSSRRTG